MPAKCPVARALCFSQETMHGSWRYLSTHAVKRHDSAPGRKIIVRIKNYPPAHAPQRRLSNVAAYRPMTAICLGNSHPSGRARQFASHGSDDDPKNGGNKLNPDSYSHPQIEPDCGDKAEQICKKEGVAEDDHKNAYHHAMRSARDDWRRCVRLLLQMSLREQPRGGSRGQPSAALGSDHAVPATTLGYNIALSARHLPWDQALRLMHSMEEVAIVPNARTYGTLLRVLRNKWRRALHVWQHLPVEHCDVISANSVIYALSRGKQWQRALDVLRELEAPDAFSFSSVIHGVPGHRWKVALCLLSEAERRGVANTYTYTACLASLEKAYQWESALGILDRLNNLHKIKQAAKTSMGAGDMRFAWNSVLSCLMKASEWEKALSLFRSVESDAVGEMALAAGLLKVGQYQQVAELLPHLRAETLMVVAYRLAWHVELHYCI
eukprot:GEMP01035803.1.p1 GENE.GEMP01035803.1~~GEMP01035803.1.p1  ORF type:complete len:438 (-),score=87.83 GEMP01035803.1:652-1965(-)